MCWYSLNCPGVQLTVVLTPFSKAHSFLKQSTSPPTPLMDDAALLMRTSYLPASVMTQSPSPPRPFPASRGFC